eukprot:scaffold186692_cov43-Tisochrysis_lutea.AAC.5
MANGASRDLGSTCESWSWGGFMLCASPPPSPPLDLREYGERRAGETTARARATSGTRDPR